MSCGCKTSDADAQRKTDEVLDHVGLRGIVDQGHGALSEASDALSHIAAPSAPGPGLRRRRGADAQRPGDAQQPARLSAAGVPAPADRRARRGGRLEGLVERVQGRSASTAARSGSRTRAPIRMQFLEQDPGLSGPVAGQALALLTAAWSARGAAASTASSTSCARTASSRSRASGRRRWAPAVRAGVPRPRRRPAADRRRPERQRLVRRARRVSRVGVQQPDRVADRLLRDPVLLVLLPPRRAGDVHVHQLICIAAFSPNCR